LLSYHITIRFSVNIGNIFTECDATFFASESTKRAGYEKNDFLKQRFNSDKRLTGLSDAVRITGISLQIKKAGQLHPAFRFMLISTSI